MQDAKKIAKNSPSGHHCTSLSGYIFATKACIDRQSEELLNSSISSTCLHNMVNFGPLTAEIGSGVWGHPCKFQRVSHLGSITARHSSRGRQPNFAAFNRGRHLYSAGRPSRWASARILVLILFCAETVPACSQKCVCVSAKKAVFLSVTVLWIYVQWSQSRGEFILLSMRRFFTPRSKATSIAYVS